MRFCPEGMSRVNVNAWRTTKRFPSISLFLSPSHFTSASDASPVNSSYIFCLFLLYSLPSDVQSGRKNMGREKRSKIKSETKDMMIEKEQHEWHLHVFVLLFLSLLSYSLMTDWTSTLATASGFFRCHFFFVLFFENPLIFFIFTPCFLIWWLLFISPPLFICALQSSYGNDQSVTTWVTKVIIIWEVVNF